MTRSCSTRPIGTLTRMTRTPRCRTKTTATGKPASTTTKTRTWTESRRRYPHQLPEQVVVPLAHRVGAHVDMGQYSRLGGPPPSVANAVVHGVGGHARHARLMADEMAVVSVEEVDDGVVCGQCRPLAEQEH